jgi:reactive intermediate/imine deaminase
MRTEPPIADGGVEIETFMLDSMPPGLPFPSAVRVGDRIYVSGVIGHQPGALKLVEGGLEAEAHQAMAYMRDALALAGSSLDRVVKCTVFFANMADFAAFNEIYRGYFTHHLPARSGVEVKGLALGARIEIECMAIL